MNRTQFSYENQDKKATMESVRVGGFCRVEKFDPAKMTVDVQPLSKALDGGIYRTPPPVLGVPVALIRGGGFVHRPWYVAGDVGVLVYMDHDIDRIMDSGQECQPNTERNHSDEDAVFVGAISSRRNNTLKGLPEEAIVMATDGGDIQVAITKDKATIKKQRNDSGFHRQRNKDEHAGRDNHCKRHGDNPGLDRQYQLGGEHHASSYQTKRLLHRA